MEHDEHVHSCWVGSGCFPLLSPSASSNYPKLTSVCTEGRERKRTRIETSQIKSLASALSFPLLDVHERWGPCWDKRLKSSRRPSDVSVRRKPGCMGGCLFSLLFFFLPFFFPTSQGLSNFGPGERVPYSSRRAREGRRKERERKRRGCTQHGSSAHEPQTQFQLILFSFLSFLRIFPRLVTSQARMH